MQLPSRAPPLRPGSALKFTRLKKPLRLSIAMDHDAIDGSDRPGSISAIDHAAISAYWLSCKMR